MGLKSENEEGKGHARDEKIMVYHAARWGEEHVAMGHYKWPIN
jgi:hypothetical protein